MENEQLMKRLEDLEESLEVIATFVMEHVHSSPVSKHCEEILAREPICEDGYKAFTGQRAYVLCRAFQTLENKEVKSFSEAIRLGWKEVHEKCRV
ncbi:MAG: hypothetical protein QMD22_10975, partial [archaeon]|nr:hypothetical protein [archaeon]